MVFQEYALLPWKTTIGNVAFGLQLKGMAKPERLRIAQTFVDFVGLAGFEQKYPHQLSGGMRQRAAVARALANGPAILLMDEPFAAIDAIMRRRLQEEIGEILANARMTVLFVTHSVDEAVFLSDRVIALSGRPGRIAGDFRIDLPRPRRWAAVAKDERFTDLRDRLLESFGQEPEMAVDSPA
jgi:NitT/TauT family transport system ATP-binding protein